MSSNVGNTPNLQTTTPIGQTSRPVDSGKPPSTLATQGFKITKIDYSAGPGEALVSYDRNGATTTLKFKGDFIAKISGLSQEKMQEAVGELVKMAVATKDAYANFKSARVDMNDLKTLSIQTKDNKTYTGTGINANVLTTASKTIQKCKDILWNPPSVGASGAAPPITHKKYLQHPTDPKMLNLSEIDFDKEPELLEQCVKAALNDPNYEDQLIRKIDMSNNPNIKPMAGKNARRIMAIVAQRNESINNAVSNQINLHAPNKQQVNTNAAHQSGPNDVSSYLDEIRQNENRKPTRQRGLSSPETAEAALNRTPSFLFPQIEVSNKNGKEVYSFKPLPGEDKAVVEHFKKAVKSENFIAVWKFLKTNPEALEKVDPQLKETLSHILLRFNPTAGDGIKKLYLNASTGDIQQACNNILDALKAVPPKTDTILNPVNEPPSPTSLSENERDRF